MIIIPVEINKFNKYIHKYIGYKWHQLSLSGRSLLLRKQSNSTAASLRLSLGIMWPAPFTDAKVNPLSFQTIPATWSSCLWMPGTHHSLHCSTIGTPNSSFILVIQCIVPVMGTLLSTSPEVTQILRPALMRMGYSQ